jgi:hypothetical protein
VAAFRLLLVAFGVGVTFFAIRFIATGNRQYLVWSLRLLGAALISGVVFFGVLLVTRFA